MRNTKYWTAVAVALALIVGAGAFTILRGQSTKSLSENDLIKRMKVLDEDEIITLIGQKGIAFKLDEDVLDRLKEAGASPKVLAALRKSALARRPGNTIDYEGILKLLKEDVSEKQILKQLDESPTRFVPSTAQVRELRRAGASDRLIAALQQNRMTVSSDIAEYALILDCSGSMADKTPEGETKMEAAKKAVTDLIHSLPNGKRLTFVVYGHKVFGKNKTRGCQAVEVVCSGRELSSPLKDALERAIATLKPVGWTPIALSLRTTGEELAKRKGMCQFMLITDGMETCGGDPALEAKKLNQQLNLAGGVNVILFGGDEKEKDAVKKIADEGGGKYYDAGSVKDLLRDIKDVEDRTKIAAKVKGAANAARRAQASAEEAEEASASAKMSADQAAEVAEGAAEAKPAAGRAKQSAREAALAATEAREAFGEAKKAADSARGAQSLEDAAGEEKTASGAANRAADKASEAGEAAQAAADARNEATTAVAAAKANRRRPAQDDDEPDRPKLGKLPESDRIRWDISLLKDKENFTLVKQTATNKQVTWVVEVNSNEGVELAKERARDNFGAGRPYCELTLQFLDEDDVQIFYYRLTVTGKVAKGEKVRLSYELPKDGIPKNTKKILLIDWRKQKKSK